MRLPALRRALAAPLLLCILALPAQADTASFTLTGAWQKIGSAGATIDVQNNNGAGYAILSTGASGAPSGGAGQVLGPGEHRLYTLAADLYAIGTVPLLVTTGFSGPGALPPGAASLAAQTQLDTDLKATQPRAIVSNAPRVSASGNLANSNDAVTAAVDGMNTAIVQLAPGAWSGTAAFEASADGGTTWTAVNMVPYAGGAAAGSATAGGLWEMAVGGLTHVRVRATGAITSGPVAAVVAATNGLKSVRVGAPSGNPVPTTDFNNAPFVDFAALTADDTAGHNVTAGKSVEVDCTVAGNISLKLANGKAKVLPVQVGYQTFPWAAVGLNATGTTATAGVLNWY